MTLEPRACPDGHCWMSDARMLEGPPAADDSDSDNGWTSSLALARLVLRWIVNVGRVHAAIADDGAIRYATLRWRRQQVEQRHHWTATTTSCKTRQEGEADSHCQCQCQCQCTRNRRDLVIVSLCRCFFRFRFRFCLCGSVFVSVSVDVFVSVPGSTVTRPARSENERRASSTPQLGA